MMPMRKPMMMFPIMLIFVMFMMMKMTNLRMMVMIKLAMAMILMRMDIVPITTMKKHDDDVGDFAYKLCDGNDDVVDCDTENDQEGVQDDVANASGDVGLIFNFFYIH